VNSEWTTTQPWRWIAFGLLCFWMGFQTGWATVRPVRELSTVFCATKDSVGRLYNWPPTANAQCFLSDAPLPERWPK